MNWKHHYPGLSEVGKAWGFSLWAKIRRWAENTLIKISAGGDYQWFRESPKRKIPAKKARDFCKKKKTEFIIFLLSPFWPQLFRI
jgi:hypothetical protein